jgi:hypothetical protein
MLIRKLDSWAYVIIWEFRVWPQMRERFEAAYGPQGEWTRLFRQDKHYIGTELIRNLRSGRTYLTLDFWTSRRAYESFRKRHAAEYNAIDAQCEALTEIEREIGRYVRAKGRSRRSKAERA